MPHKDNKDDMIDILAISFFIFSSPLQYLTFWAAELE